MRINKPLWKISILFLLFCFFLSGLAFSKAKLEKIEIDANKNYDQAFIYTSEHITPKVMFLENPYRLVFDLPGVKVKPQKIAGKGNIIRVRIGQFSYEPLVARIVFDLKSKVEFEYATLFGKNKIFIEMAKTLREVPVVVYKEPKKKVEKVAPKKIVKKPVVPKKKKVEKKEPVEKKAVEKKALEKKVAKKKVVKKKKKRAPILKGKVIVIDPGHGGKDPGARANGFVEKRLCLKTSLQLASLLKKAGAQVFLTRKNDTKKRLKEVTRFANRIGADIFVSIHYNSSYSSRISGTETYFYTRKSLKLAKKIQRSMTSGLRTKDRGVRKGMFYIIHHTRMPAVIVEPVFITNYHDAQRIKGKKFYKKVAWNIVRGIKSYFSGAN
jgi:N-acetylmuramoyl-L-alanine amidase